VRDPVAAHDRGRVVQPQRLGQLAGGEERAAGPEDHRDLVDHHLVDQPEPERLAADLTGGHVDDPLSRSSVVEAYFDGTERDSVLGTYSITEEAETTLDAPLAAYRVEDGEVLPAR
jgi:hypothetical protein